VLSFQQFIICAWSFVKQPRKSCLENEETKINYKFLQKQIENKKEKNQVLFGMGNALNIFAF